MTLMEVVVAGGCGLPKNRTVRARLKPHLDADPELLAALLVHLELARDGRAVVAARSPSPNRSMESRLSARRHD